MFDAPHQTVSIRSFRAAKSAVFGEELLDCEESEVILTSSEVSI